MSVTSIRIENDLMSALEHIAHNLRRSKSWVINEALKEYLSHHSLEESRWQDTLAALEDIRMGRVVDSDKVHSWLESWGTDKELKSPRKS